MAEYNIQIKTTCSIGHEKEISREANFKPSHDANLRLWIREDFLKNKRCECGNPYSQVSVLNMELLKPRRKFDFFHIFK